MTKNFTHKLSKCLLAFVLVVGGVNSSVAKAFALENSTEEVALSQIETTDTEAFASMVTSDFDTVVEEPTDVPVPAADLVDDAKTAANETLSMFKVEMDAAIDALTTLSAEDKFLLVERYNFYVEMWKENVLNKMTVEELDAFMVTTTALHQQELANLAANNVVPNPVDEAFIAAQIAALDTLQTLLSDMVSAIDGLVHTTDAEKLNLKSSMTELNTLWGTLALESANIEDLNLFIADISTTNAQLIQELLATDAAFAATLANAITTVYNKLAEVTAQINALSPMTDAIRQEHLALAQENATLALSYISSATTVESIQTFIDVANKQFDAIVVGATLDQKIAAINVRIDQAYDVIVASGHLTDAQKNAKIAEMNAIVDALNKDMAAVAADMNLDFVATILALNTLFDTSVVALEALLTSIIPAAATYTLSFNSWQRGPNVAQNMPSDQILKAGDLAATVSNPTLLGYIFGGWQTNGYHDYETGKHVPPTDFILGVTPMLNRDVELMAQWDVDTTLQHTLTFDLVGGEGVAPEAQLLYGGQQAAAVPAPTREGYTFIGWLSFNSELGGMGTMYAFGTPDFTMPGYDVVAYAHWEKNDSVIAGVNGDSTLPNTGLQMEIYSVALLAVLGSLVLITKNRSNKLQK